MMKKQGKGDGHIIGPAVDLKDIKKEEKEDKKEDKKGK